MYPPPYFLALAHKTSFPHGPFNCLLNLVINFRPIFYVVYVELITAANLGQYNPHPIVCKRKLYR